MSRACFEILEDIVRGGWWTISSADRDTLHTTLIRDDAGNVRLTPAERDSMARVLGRTVTAAHRSRRNRLGVAE